MVKNNIEIARNFIKTGEGNLLVNQVNEEIGCFYEIALKEISKEFDVKITNNLDPKNEISYDLFDSRKINLITSTNSKLIKQMFDMDGQNIVLTDYKNYKKLQKDFISINGYEFKKDLAYFLKIFDINNDNLFNYCLGMPFFTFSEISKYKLNILNYTSDPVTNETTNFIVNIRKDIFKFRNSEKDLKKLFIKLKSEVKYKKFSFLTF